MVRIVLNIAYLVCLALMVFVGLFYTVLSPGLATYTPDGASFCNQLSSSGSDDDAMILAFTWFLVPIVLRILRLAREVARLEAFALCVCQVLAIFALWLASLDCASIFYTAFIVPDPFLAGVLISLPGSLVALLILWKVG